MQKSPLPAGGGAKKFANTWPAKTDEGLLRCPPGCAHSAFTLALAQYRHLHTHLGMLMGVVIAEGRPMAARAGLGEDFLDGDAAIFCRISGWVLADLL